MPMQKSYGDGMKSPDQCLQKLQSEINILDKCTMNQHEARNAQGHFNTTIECMKELTKMLAAPKSDNTIWVEKHAVKLKELVEKCQDCVETLQDKKLIQNTRDFDTQCSSIQDVLAKCSGKRSPKHKRDF